MTLSTHTLSSPAYSMQRSFSYRDLIPLQPDALWHINWGAVRTLTWNEEGTPITLGYWGPGDVVGQPLSRIQPYQIECLTSVEVCYVSSGECFQAIEALLLHIQQAEEILTIVRHERMHSRLQQLLVWLARKFGRSVQSGLLIDLRLTHQAIAEAIGTTRVTVTRLLNEFEREGIISRPKRHFIVLQDGFLLELS
jgi:CRP-like cAMP-binding protein